MPLPDAKAGAYPRFSVMGKAFDPDKAEAYAQSFAIKRT
jgi:nitrate/nitrite transport system substrate-binding protein